MNRSAIKNFATWARRYLREQVTARAFLIVKDADDESELLRETWTISLGITNDFGDF